VSLSHLGSIPYIERLLIRERGKESDILDHAC